MRVKVQYRSASLENYKKFTASRPHIKISYEDFCKIVYDYSYLLRDYILHTGDQAKMMWGMGDFTIQKRKRKKTFIDNLGKERNNLAIDWKETRKEGKRVYNFNFHTDGYGFRWKWIRKSALFHQSSIWSFKPSRLTSRSLSAQLLKDPLYSQIYQE